MKSSPLNPWSAEKLRDLRDQALPGDPRGQEHQLRGGSDQFERLRKRCLKEAEAKFQEEIHKLGPQSSNSSFQSAVEAPGGKVQGEKIQPGGEAKWEANGHVKTTAPIVNGSQWRRHGVCSISLALYPPGLACVAFFRMDIPIHQVHLACGCQLRNHWAIMLGRWNCRCWA